MGYEFETEMRRLRAARASDIEELVYSLGDAASRFEDLADIIEKNPKYDAPSFMRASAERYRAVLRMWRGEKIDAALTPELPQ